MSEKILVVDDEREIADLLEVYLKNENYTQRELYTNQCEISYSLPDNIEVKSLD